MAESDSIRMVKIRSAINSIASTLRLEKCQKRIGMQITETFLGGSVGQGNAVANYSDVDLVVFSRDLDPDKISEDEEYLHSYLKKINYNLKIRHPGSYQLKYFIKTGLKFIYELEGVEIQVDLLLSPFWESKQDLFGKISTLPPHQRWKLFAGASKEQNNFVSFLTGVVTTRSQAQRVSELIRRAKAWKIQQWKGEKKISKPRGYLLSVLVITAYSRTPEELKDSKFSRFAPAVQVELIKLVEEIATARRRYDLIIPGSDMALRTKYSRMLPRCPRICDPVNPFNNLYISGVQCDEEGRRDWAIINERMKVIDLSLTDEQILIT